MTTRAWIASRLRLDGDGLGTYGRAGRLRPRRRLAVAALGGAALIVVLLVLGRLGDDGTRDGSERKRGARTATVTRRTLVAREIVEGTLGYSGARAVVNRLAIGDGSAAGAGGGTGGGASGGGGGSGDGPGGSASGSGSRSGAASGRTASVDGGRASADAASSTGARSYLASNDVRRGGAQDGGRGGGRDSGSRSSGGSAGGGGGSAGGGRASGGAKTGGDGGGPSGGGPSGGGPSGGSPSGGSKKGGSAKGGGNKGGERKGGGNKGGERKGGGSGGDASQGSGTVTGLAREGSIVGRGERLYELDGRPVLLMYGSMPAYRKLGAATTDGPDVRQLERNLVALGFGRGVTVNEDFTAATAAAVRRWQRARGLPQTGEVELGRVVFLPGARRVGAHKVKVGSVLGAGSEVFTTSSLRRVVTVELDVAKQSLVQRGDSVTVTLPDGTTVRGRIARVGRVARKKDEGDGGTGGDVPGGSSSGSGELVIDLSIVLRSRRAVSRLDEAPVTVGIAQETRRRVLAVPVTALLARAGAGYGVEVLRGERRRMVAVETGLFASGLVEISGRGIRPGTKVAIPEE